MHPAKASSISDCTPATRSTRQPTACPARYSSSADLPTPGSPCTTSTRLSPARTASTSPSSTRRSARRSVSLLSRPRGLPFTACRAALHGARAADGGTTGARPGLPGLPRA